MSIDWQGAVAQVYRDVRGWLAGFTIEIAVVLTLIGLVVAGIVSLMRIDANAAAEQAALIEQCLRAFEYTRDQCEFIVRSGVMVKP